MSVGALQRRLRDMRAGDAPSNPHPRRAEALQKLPHAYSLALRLRDAGLSEDLVAECISIEPEALGLLLQVAEAKLATILHDELRR